MDIREADWLYIGFEWQGLFYTFTQLPFRLASAAPGFDRFNGTRAMWEPTHAHSIVFCDAARKDRTSIWGVGEPGLLQMLA